MKIPRRATKHTYSAFYKKDPSRVIASGVTREQVLAALPEGCKVVVDPENTVGRTDDGDDLEFAMFQHGRDVIVVVRNNEDEQMRKPKWLTIEEHSWGTRIVGALFEGVSIIAEVRKGSKAPGYPTFHFTGLGPERTMTGSDLSRLRSRVADVQVWASNVQSEYAAKRSE